MRSRALFGAALTASSLALAQSSDVPLHNWTVPPYAHSSSGGITTMTDATPPRAFIGLQPCRVADTRGNGAPIAGGILNATETRTWDLTGICGIPADADAISGNFTVTGAPTAPPGSFILAWPTGGPIPPVSVLNFQAGQTIANAAIVPLGPGEQINVNTSATVHVILDVNGYFSETLNSPGSLQLYSNTSVDTILGNNSGGGNGVHGHTSTTNLNRAGVFGTQSAEAVLDNYFAHGVRGQGPGGGVLGISSYEGTSGSLISAGHEIAWGALGLAILNDPGCSPSATCGPPWAIFAGGNTGATGTKNFLDPHPTDPKLAIAYVSLEGPEAGTYFRGRARFQNGTARIVVPEHFRLVTDPEGLTVQITPIGAMATVAVLRMDLSEIVVQASRNVEFSYLVQGVRATFKDVGPLRAAGDFMPRSADARMPEWLSSAQKRRLVQNGTYGEDGRVNMETARRLGWDRIWEERSRPAPQPVAP